MDFLNTWLQGIIVSVIIASIIEMIIPNGNNKKYIKMVLGVYVVFNIITPIVNKISKNNFELSSIINIDKYEKELQTYEVGSDNSTIEENNKQNIKQIYILNLKKDMKAKLEEKDYKVKDIEILLKENENYEINEITIYLEEKDNKNKSEDKENENIIAINQIENIDIHIGDTKEEIDNKNSISENEKSEIIKYLTSMYELKEKQINIY